MAGGVDGPIIIAGGANGVIAVGENRTTAVFREAAGVISLAVGACEATAVARGVDGALSVPEGANEAISGNLRS